MNRISIMRQGEMLVSCAAGGEVQLHFHGVYQPVETLVPESDSRRIIAGIDHPLHPARLFLPE